MIVVIDGNDGTGKSTLVKSLQDKGYKVKDRGIPTKLTDNPRLRVIPNEIYVILDAPVEVSRERLEKAGRDLNEKYHTVEDLTKYRKRFLEVANQIDCLLIDASRSSEEVFEEVIHNLKMLSYLDFRAFDPPTIETFAIRIRKDTYFALIQAIQNIRFFRELYNENHVLLGSVPQAFDYVARSYHWLGKADKGVSVMYDINHPLSYSACKASNRVKRILEEEISK